MSARAQVLCGPRAAIVGRPAAQRSQRRAQVCHFRVSSDVTRKADLDLFHCVDLATDALNIEAEDAQRDLWSHLHKYVAPHAQAQIGSMFIGPGDQEQMLKEAFFGNFKCMVEEINDVTIADSGDLAVITLRTCECYNVQDKWREHFGKVASQTQTEGTQHKVAGFYTLVAHKEPDGTWLLCRIHRSALPYEEFKEMA